jgi:hypothetical protein
MNHYAGLDVSQETAICVTALRERLAGEAMAYFLLVMGRRASAAVPAAIATTRAGTTLPRFVARCRARAISIRAATSSSGGSRLRWFRNRDSRVVDRDHQPSHYNFASAEFPEAVLGWRVLSRESRRAEVVGVT